MCKTTLQTLAYNPNQIKPNHISHMNLKHEIPSAVWNQHHCGKYPQNQHWSLQIAELKDGQLKKNLKTADKTCISGHDNQLELKTWKAIRCVRNQHYTDTNQEIRQDSLSNTRTTVKSRKRDQNHRLNWYRPKSLRKTQETEAITRFQEKEKGIQWMDAQIETRNTAAKTRVFDYGKLDEERSEDLWGSGRGRCRHWGHGGSQHWSRRTWSELGLEFESFGQWFRLAEA